MIKVRDNRGQIAIAKAHKANQDHIFRFWEETSEEDRRSLLDQVGELDFQRLKQLAQRIGEGKRVRKLEPPTGTLSVDSEADRERLEQAAKAGREAFRKGRVAGLIVAGGQGTRLGFEGPKGSFPIGPVTERSLFQIFAEHALAIARRYRSSFPLYIMTSRQNHEAIERFFRERDHFGMSPADVVLFRQPELPVVDRRGRLLLADKARIATSPNGHGGVLDALLEGGGFEDMKRRGVDLLSYWQVDNPLVTVHDPTFIGLLEEEGVEAAAKVTPKRSVDEPVGVWGMIDGDLGVIEYSELPADLAEQRLEGEGLRFSASNLAIHAFRCSFLERIARSSESLPYHLAHKKVPHVGRNGELVVPDKPNGVKFERFIFDSFRLATRTVLLEVRRADEFSPVKNAEGEDSPASSRCALSAMYGRWLEAAGSTIERNGDEPSIEISPLTAQNPEDLQGRIEPGTVIADSHRM
ncbi:MAG: UTP--glucose-1-phosphate uridylyltransferase [Planctomycetota bacterium]